MSAERVPGRTPGFWHDLWREGGVPCDIGGTGLIFPEESHGASSTPPPKDQFQPALQNDLTKLVTGKAEYSCKTKMPYTEDWTVTRDISLPAIPKETEQAGRVRLEKAARDLTKTIHGCFDVRFVRFLPAAGEALKAKQVRPAETSSKEVLDRCAPGGEWEHSPICSK